MHTLIAFTYLLTELRLMGRKWVCMAISR